MLASHLAPPLISENCARPLLQRPDIWRASELAVSMAPVCATGHTVLDAELPNRGWPRSTLIELLLQQVGSGEMQLLKPALALLSKSARIALVQPPHIPQAMACAAWGMDISRLLWIRAQHTADALWTTEQILKNGSCGAVILWQSNVRPEALRRLNLAAHSTDTWLWLMRPLSCAADASPAPLRLALRPAMGGVSLDIVKRQGPCGAGPLFVPLADMPAGRHLLEPHYASVPERPFALVATRNLAPVLV